MKSENNEDFIYIHIDFKLNNFNTNLNGIFSLTADILLQVHNSEAGFPTRHGIDLAIKVHIIKAVTLQQICKNRYFWKRRQFHKPFLWLNKETMFSYIKLRFIAVQLN